MKLTIIPAAVIRINRRLAAKGLEWLDSEQCQLISKVWDSTATPAQIADCHAMLSEDLPNRCGIETADLYAITEDAPAAQPTPGPIKAKITNGDGMLLHKLKSFRHGLLSVPDNDYTQAIANYRVYCLKRDLGFLIGPMAQLIAHWDSVIASEGTEFPNGAFDSVETALEDARAALSKAKGEV